MPVVHLEELNEDEFRALIDRLDRGYAAEHARAGTCSKENALSMARAETARILPNGTATPDQYLFKVIDDRSGRRVGEVWYALRTQGGLPQLWIFWLGIARSRRRRGLATAVLRRLEEEARRLGSGQIALHVFGSNAAARALYAKMGYVETSLLMRKVVPHGPSRGRLARSA